VVKRAGAGWLLRPSGHRQALAKMKSEKPSDGQSFLTHGLYVGESLRKRTCGGVLGGRGRARAGAHRLGVAAAFTPVVLHGIVLEDVDAALLADALPLDEKALERAALLPPKRAEGVVGELGDKASPVGQLVRVPLDAELALGHGYRVVQFKVVDSSSGWRGRALEHLIVE
jgi:hypothetical protein